MVGLGCVVAVSTWPHHRILPSFSTNYEHSVKPASSSWTFPGSTKKNQPGNSCSTKCRIGPTPLFALPKNKVSTATKDEDVEEGTAEQLGLPGWSLLSRNSGIVSSCLVGLLTGVAVVFFNYIVSELQF